MINILLSGCRGRMGRVIDDLVSGMDDCRIVCGYDIVEDNSGAYPVYNDLSKCNNQADVIIDFSNPAALPSLYAYAEANSLPIVVATTGLDEQLLADTHALSEKVAVFYSGNMSLGINLLSELVKKAAAVLGDSFDIEIVEKHHNQKLDAPSGTALMLADAAASALDEAPHYEYDRHSRRMKRPKNEIGIHAVRGGTIVGEHEVIFAGHNEVVTLSHSAQSREVFAAGAVSAAKFICGLSAGMYNMSDLVNSK